jgi:xylan 1,4-beta-xylosidase
MGSPPRPTPEQEAKLKAAGQLEMMGSPQWVDVAGGEVKITMKLPRQATSLLKIRW